MSSSHAVRREQNRDRRQHTELLLGHHAARHLRAARHGERARTQRASAWGRGHPAATQHEGHPEPHASEAAPTAKHSALPQCADADSRGAWYRPITRPTRAACCRAWRTRRAALASAKSRRSPAKLVRRAEARAPEHPSQCEQARSSCRRSNVSSGASLIKHQPGVRYDSQGIAAYRKTRPIARMRTRASLKDTLLAEASPLAWGIGVGFRTQFRRSWRIPRSQKTGLQGFPQKHLCIVRPSPVQHMCLVEGLGALHHQDGTPPRRG